MRWLLTLSSLEWVPYSPIPSPTPSFFVRSPFLPFCPVSSFANATLLWTSALRRSSLPCAWSDFSVPHPSSILSSNVSTLLLAFGDPLWSFEQLRVALLWLYYISIRFLYYHDPTTINTLTVCVNSIVTLDKKNAQKMTISTGEFERHDTFGKGIPFQWSLVCGEHGSLDIDEVTI